ncbi:MAG: MBL fold metallo-hydrolase [Candidatus Omnitrophota bacterium]|jgi:7,8-dihydropterin-6-yl-methyl-4-(beta-D-ribofuranosyl)aminobenzene 5'-phosphate synthase
MKIKIIAIGSSKWERFIRRWGVSFLIGEGLLFDAFGDPGVFVNNMRKFHIDPVKIKHIVLSHDDWDHISGLWYLLADRKDVTVYICPGFNQEIKNRIASFGVRVIEVEPFTEIKKDIFSTGQIQGSCAGRIIFEQALAVKSSKHITIITACAHPGIVNIVNTVRKHFSNERVYFILGGLHLKDNTNEINTGIIQELRDLGVCKVSPMHCTGKRATEAMREAFGYGFVQAKEGDVIEL